MHDLRRFSLQRSFAERLRLLTWLPFALLVDSGWVPGRLRVVLLKAFGGQIGKGCVIKKVYVKEPWNLRVGSHTWIGRGVDIDNPGPVVVGNNVCISQHVKIISGSHDLKDPGFALVCHEVEIGDDVWVAAGASLIGNLSVSQGAFIRPFSVLIGGHKRQKVMSSN